MFPILYGFIGTFRAEEMNKTESMVLIVFSVLITGIGGDKMTKTEFQIKSWDERPYFEGIDGIKLTRAAVIKTYTGEISGEGFLEYLMAYTPDGTADFTGIERVVGMAGNRTGSFLLFHTGTFQNGVATSSCRVIEGSATGELKGMTGSGGFSTGHSMTVAFDFDYQFNR
jgi:hypothetical protein